MHFAPQSMPEPENKLPDIGEKTGQTEPSCNSWSTRQFSLYSLMSVVTSYCLACGVIKTLGFPWFGGLFMFTILYVYVWFCYRLGQHK